MRIGKYEIQGELGHGGFGIVYRAYDPSIPRHVAIKILTAEASPELLGRFRAEAATTASLTHKYIVTVYDYGEHEGAPYLAMELLKGENLKQLIERRAPLTLLEKVRIMSQVAEGLHFAHERGVVHRDVTPANIMLLPGGEIKIMDFGIARVTSHASARHTQKGDLLGTMRYLSPERFTGADADALSDIFAYGVVYYELVSGIHPFDAKDIGTVMFRITSVDPVSLMKLTPDCVEGLDLLIQRALAKEREVRYQSLQDVLFDSAPILADLRHQRAATILEVWIR